MEIIPAIDIIDGKCVRLTQGDYNQKNVYTEHPLEVAKQFEAAGLRRLHLGGSRRGQSRCGEELESVGSHSRQNIDGGRFRRRHQRRKRILPSCLIPGAALATIGSLAVKNETVFVQWLEQYGAGKFLLGADVKEEKIAVGGWLETTDIWIYDFIEKYMQKGVQQVFCTDVSKDGLLQGPSVDLYKEILDRFPSLHFIASGGVSSTKDLESLQKIGCKGVIVGKAIYEGRIKLEDLVKL